MVWLQHVITIKKPASNIMVWLQHVITSRPINSTSIHAASSVFLLRCECSGTDQNANGKNVRLWCE